MRKLFIIIAWLPFICFAQKQGNIWYFGNHAGIDLSGGSPVILNNGQTYVIGCPACHSEGSSIMCDSSGALLFYCNGQQIWNKNQQIMQDGDSLLSTASSTQGSLIVPLPGSNRFFYVFTVDDFYLDNLQYGFRYSIVDICLDNGLGGVVSGEKNILLLDTVAEKLTGVRHANGTDYWIIVHKYYSDAFYSYHLSSAGIIDTVISHVGSVHPTGTSSTGGSIGQLKASPNGLKLAIVNGNTNFNIAEYFDFDKNTGIVSNMVSIQTNPFWNYYGVSFSPDNSKLYIACIINGNGIYQFDLNAGGGNPADVIASKTLIAGYYNYFALQLANNGKIYCTRSPFNYNPYLGVINYPNIAGVGCNYVDSAVNLINRSASYGLPNFIDSYDYSNTISDCSKDFVEQINEKQYLVFPSPFNSELNITTGQNEKSEIIIYDITSRKILEQSFMGSTILNTEHFASGIYMYEMRNKNGVIKKGKVVKED